MKAGVQTPALLQRLCSLLSRGAATLRMPARKLAYRPSGSSETPSPTQSEKSRRDRRVGHGAVRPWVGGEDWLRPGCRSRFQDGLGSA